MMAFVFVIGDTVGVYVDNILSHFPYEKLLEFLQNLHVILAPGSRTYLTFMDFDALATSYLMNKLNLRQASELLLDTDYRVVTLLDIKTLSRKLQEICENTGLLV